MAGTEDPHGIRLKAYRPRGHRHSRARKIVDYLLTRISALAGGPVPLVPLLLPRRTVYCVNPLSAQDTGLSARVALTRCSHAQSRMIDIIDPVQPRTVDLADSASTNSWPCVDDQESEL